MKDERYKLAITEKTIASTKPQVIATSLNSPLAGMEVDRSRCSYGIDPLYIVVSRITLAAGMEHSVYNGYTPSQRYKVRFPGNEIKMN